MKPAPSGTVAFLFTDIEGSTVRWEAHPNAMKAALRRHDALLRSAIEAHAGHVFKTIGDAFCATFATVAEATGAALDAQRALARSEWGDVDGVRVRMAIHAGVADQREGDYFGQAVNRVARLLAIGHGGQVLFSASAAHLAQDSLPATASLRDLGEHRLKDLSVAERVYQLEAQGLPANFPPLRSLDAARHNLPNRVTSFVGRAKEIDELTRALEGSRLVTLAGPGGVGKTRLVLEAALALLDGFPDGVWLVELAALSNPELVAHEFAAVIRAPALAEKSVEETVVSSLGHKKALLIVDNCEHVIGAAGALIGAILRRAPEIRVIATSRQPLDISGETTLRVASLEVPPADKQLALDEVRAYDSVRLFEERARAATGFTLSAETAPAVAQIARSLDGIPLAIELAAPKLALLSPSQLANRLNERMRLLTGGDRTALRRQQTLRALIDWSHDLLDERERTLFRLLASFSGGWTLEAAEYVCGGAGIDEPDVLALLGALVEKSLVVADTSGSQTRYGFLQSIREYAAEQLAASGQASEGARRHASYHAAYVRDQHALSAAMNDLAWRAQILAELDNVRSALEWTLVHRNDARVGLEILADLRRPRLVFLPPEAVRWFALGVQAARDVGDAQLSAKVLAWHASANLFGETSLSARVVVTHEAVAAARLSGDRAILSNALGTLGICLRDAGRLDEADAVFAEAKTALGSECEAIDRATLYGDWASNDLKRGDVKRARERLEASLGSSRPGSMLAAGTLLILAEIEFASGDREKALALARESKEAFVALEAPLEIGAASSNLAAYAIAADAFDEARDAVAEALAQLRGVGSLYLTIALEHRAVLAALTGNLEPAAHLLGFTDGSYVAMGLVREGTEKAGFVRANRLLVERLGLEVLARAMSAGAQMSESEALAYAFGRELAAGPAVIS